MPNAATTISTPAIITAHTGVSLPISWLLYFSKSATYSFIVKARPRAASLATPWPIPYPLAMPISRATITRATIFRVIRPSDVLVMGSISVALDAGCAPIGSIEHRHRRAAARRARRARVTDVGDRRTQVGKPQRRDGGRITLRDQQHGQQQTGRHGRCAI